MEARKFGFGSDMPPVFKFDPTDADIVAFYLLPRALHLPNPYAHAIIVADPTIAPPWEILQKYGHADSKYAFFFGPSTARGRRSRAIQDVGVWWAKESEEGTVTLLRSGDDAEVDIRYRRCSRTFRSGSQDPSTGYVMDEYEILSPRLPRTVLSRIKITKKYNNSKRPVVAPAAAAEQQVADPEQAGPSYEQDAAAITSNGEGFTGAQHSALCGGGMVENAGVLRYVLPETEYDNNNNYYRVPISDQPGASYNYNAAAMKSDGEGFTYAQEDINLFDDDAD